jgi:glycosyltransferase involved in cell wall biosynthesis
VKILIGHNYYQQPGGEDIAFANEKNLLRRNGHEVVEYLDSNTRLNTMGRLDAAVQTLWSRHSYQAVKTLIRNSRPDIAHFHNTFLLLSPSVYDACSEMGVPVVQTLHNYRLVCPVALLHRKGQVCEACLGKKIAWPGVWHGCYHGSRTQTAVVASMLALQWMRKTWRDRVDVFIALTEFSRRKFIEGGLPAAKILVKPNFFHPDPGIMDSAGDFALFVGRLSPEKGILTLLQAWQQISNIPLRILGSGDLEPEVHSFVEENGSGNIHTSGLVSPSQVFTTMKKARFLVCPSECYENFAMVIVEAFAFGLPVIASRLGAMAEIISDGHTGILFAPGDPEDLAAKVNWSWNHPRELVAIGRKARREYESKYTSDIIYDSLMRIYAAAQKS